MKLLVFGGNGLVGSRFVELGVARFDIAAPNYEEVDIIKMDDVQRAVEAHQPDVVVNFAAFTNVEAAEEQVNNKEGPCYQINVVGSSNIAQVCQKMDRHMVQISTDYVFNGEKETPYTEADEPDPINWYGETKYQAEQAVLESGVTSSICRISMPYRAHFADKKDIGRFFLEQLQLGNEIKAIADQWIKPTYVDDIAHALKSIIEQRLQGVVHVACTTSTTPYEFARTIANKFGLDEGLVKEVSLSEYSQNKKSRMPKYSVLDTLTFEALFPGVLHNLEESVVNFKQAVDEAD